MTIRSYFTTSDPKMLAAANDLEQARITWMAEVQEVVKEHGFQNFRAHAFHSPTQFHLNVPTASPVPALPGFSKGKLVGVGDDNRIYMYAPNNTSKGRAISSALDQRLEHHLQPEQKSGTISAWRMRDVSSILLQRLGVYTEVSTDDGFAFPTVVQCSSPEFGDELILNMPLESDDNGTFARLPIELDPALWTDRSGWAYSQRLNAHNRARGFTPAFHEPTDNDDEEDSRKDVW